MAIRRPLVITSTGDAELPAGDTLPVSMQDAYDNGASITVTTGNEIKLKATRPGSGSTLLYSFKDSLNRYMGGLFYNAVSSGLCADFGGYVNCVGYLGDYYPVYQTISIGGTLGSPSAVTASSIVHDTNLLLYNSSGAYNNSAGIRATATENQTSSNGGVKWDIYVTKTGTNSRFSALTVSDDGSIRANHAQYGDFYARGSYKHPFILYAIPAPYNMTGSATETKISADISVPANTLSSNSKLKTDILTSCTTTANGKYVIVRFGPNANNTDPVMLYFNFGGVLSQHIFDTLSCLNSATSKMGFLSWTSSSIGTSSTSKSIAMQTISVNNTVQNYITIWLKNGQTTDDSTLQMLTIEVIP